MIYKGIIETSSGNLIRCGFTDFENDGSFDSGTETFKTDVPFPGKLKKQFDDGENSDYHNFDGNDWILKTS